MNVKYANVIFSSWGHFTNGKVFGWHTSYGSFESVIWDNWFKRDGALGDNLSPSAPCQIPFGCVQCVTFLISTELVPSAQDTDLTQWLFHSRESSRLFPPCVYMSKHAYTFLSRSNSLCGLMSPCKLTSSGTYCMTMIVAHGVNIWTKHSSIPIKACLFMANHVQQPAPQSSDKISMTT